MSFSVKPTTLEALNARQEADHKKARDRFQTWQISLRRLRAIEAYIYAVNTYTKHTGNIGQIKIMVRPSLWTRIKRFFIRPSNKGVTYTTKRMIRAYKAATNQ